MSAQEKHPNDPNRGMNLKVWFTAVVLSVIALMLLAYFFLLGTGKKDIPKANQPHPNSRLVMPMQHVPLDVA
jgi:hypothetical protein